MQQKQEMAVVSRGLCRVALPTAVLSCLSVRRSESESDHIHCFKGEWTLAGGNVGGRGG